ncbi:MAG: hypothetical protein K0S12_1612 [Bacteroidetes bacterium]|jgi:hypothetical protein|nr:hypothetical protein [Bacteroidota bacterium]
MMVTERKNVGQSTEVWIDSEGILILQVEADAEVDLDEVKETFAVYHEMGIGPGNKRPQLIIAKGNALMSPEARNFANTNGVNYFKASAVITKSLTIRLVVNFFNSFYKPKIPLKMFDNEDAARKWLRSVC